MGVVKMDKKQIIEKVKIYMDNWRHDHIRLIGMEEEDTEVISHTIKLCSEAHQKEIEAMKAEKWKANEEKENIMYNKGFEDGFQSMTESIGKWHKVLDDLNAEIGNLCVYCRSQKYDGRVGIVHKPFCILLEMRKELRQTLKGEERGQVGEHSHSQPQDATKHCGNKATVREKGSHEADTVPPQTLKGEKA